MVKENERLRALLKRDAKTPKIRRLSSLELMEEREQQLYRMLRSHNRPSTLSGPSDILYPSEICSCVLFKYAAEWIWLHFAVDATSIEKQRIAFFERCDCVDPVDAMDASWLGLYFSYLTVRSNSRSGLIFNTSFKFIISTDSPFFYE